MIRITFVRSQTDICIFQTIRCLKVAATLSVFHRAHCDVIASNRLSGLVYLYASPQ